MVTCMTLLIRPCFEVPVPPEYAHNNNTTVAVGTYPCFDLCEQCHSSCAAAIISSVETFGYPYSIAELAVSYVPFFSAFAAKIDVYLLHYYLPLTICSTCVVYRAVY